MKSESSADNRVRVYHSDSKARQFLLTHFHKLLLAVEKELKMDMEIPKLDIVYVPTLETRTLVKHGLIYVGPQMIHSLLQHHSLELKEIHKEIARSVYELYFGQVITPYWWTDQWMTLGLARYFSGTTTQLDFDAEREFISDTVEMTIREHNDRYTMTYMAGPYYSVEHINIPNLLIVDHRGKR